MDCLFCEIVKGNICDLSCFEDESFDLIFNPPSLMYIPDVSVVFRECFRVRKTGSRRTQAARLCLS